MSQIAMVAPSTAGAMRQVAFVRPGESQRAFAPRSLPGLVLDLDPDYLTGLADGASVQTCPDRSGYGNHATQAAAASQPIVKDAIVNGHRVLRFGGSAQLIAAFTLAQPATVVAVLNQSVWTINKTLIDGGALNNSMAVYQNTATPQLTLFSAADGPSTTALAVGTPGILVVVLNGASSTMAVNGGVAATGDPGSRTPGGVTLGNNFTGNAGGQVDFARVLTYTRVLGASELSRLLRFLGQRYGITVS